MTLTLIDRVRQVQHGGFVVRLAAKRLALAAELHRRRKLKKELASLSPRHLRDVGLTPDDVESACSRPLARDVATELHHKAMLRCGNW